MKVVIQIGGIKMKKLRIVVKCPACGGSGIGGGYWNADGSSGQHKCINCGGKGKVEKYIECYDYIEV